jgi:hypothetical protein
MYSQWNVAFGMPQPPKSEQSVSPPLLHASTTTPGMVLPSAGLPPSQETLIHQHQTNYPTHANYPQQAPPMHGIPHQQHQQQQHPAPVIYTPSSVDSFVTPSMWQDVVASSFPYKRRWNYDMQDEHNLSEPVIKRVR